MSELISKLGIDWKLLSAQIVQFVLLIFILYKVAYKPILALLEKRSKTIEQSLDDAKKVQETLAATEVQRKQMIADTQKRAELIVADARTAADALRSETVEKTRHEMEAMRKKAERDAEAIKTQMLADAQSQLADIVVAATGKVIGERLTADQDKALVEKALSEVTPS